MDNLDFIRTRKVACDRNKILALLDDRELTAKQLAAQAGLYLETVEKMIRGEGNFKTSIRAVANALGVDATELVASPAANFAATAQPTASVSRNRTLILEFPETIFDEAETIVIRIRKTSGAQGTFVIDDDRQGNRSIVVEMNDDDAVRVTTAFITGKLEGHGIKSITVYDINKSPVVSSAAVPQPNLTKTLWAFDKKTPMPTIRYNCPSCKTNLESPAAEAGLKKPCPACGQRLQVPALKG